MVKGNQMIFEYIQNTSDEKNIFRLKEIFMKKFCNPEVFMLIFLDLSFSLSHCSLY